MKNVLIKLSIVIFVVLLAITHVASQSRNEYKEVQTSPVTWDFTMHEEPGVLLSPTRYNLGHTHNLDTLALAFNVINNKDVTVDISQIRITCPCTKLKVHDGLVSVNDELSILYDYITFGFPDNSLVRKSIWVMSPDFETNRLRAMYEAIQSFDKASFLPKKHRVVIKGDSYTLPVKNRNNKELKDFGFYSFDSEYISIEDKNSVADGDDEIVIKKVKSPKEKIESTITFFAQGDSLCVFSLPLDIYP